MTERPNKELALRYWSDDSWKKYVLSIGLFQATREGAIAQGRAMAAALQQAIEGAK